MAIPMNMAPGLSDAGGGNPDWGDNYTTSSMPGLSNNSAKGGGDWIGAGLGGLVAGGGAILNYLGGQSTNDANSAEAAQNRIFASREAETSRQYDQAKTVWQATHGYQNAVDDMRKAGLNPAMMYAGKGGAESGSGGGGAQASAPGNPVHTNAIAQGLNSAISSANLINDFRNTNADITMKQAQSLNAAAQAAAATSSARNTDEATAQLAQGRDANRAKTIRDQGDYDWEAKNRAGRMIVRSGVLGTAINSAQAVDRTLNQLITGGETDVQPWEKPRHPKFGYSELDMLNAAKGKGVLTQ